MNAPASEDGSLLRPSHPSREPTIPVINLDPAHPVTLGTSPIHIPQPTYKLSKLLHDRKTEYLEEDHDEEDSAIFADPRAEEDIDTGAESQPVLDDWVHDPAWVETCVQHLLPPPADASRMALTSLQRELAAMLKEQSDAKSRKELGWHMPLEFIGDNLFQWIIELHSFDPSLPIARDLEAK